MIFNDLSVSQNAIIQTLDASRARFYRIVRENNVEPIDATAPRKRYGVDACRRIYPSYYIKNAVNDKVNVFYNFKGGTGKTTVCFQLSCMLALAGYKVLAIDLDPQAHLTNILRFNETRRLDTVYESIINGKNIKDCICNVFEGLDAIPSSIELTKIELPLSQKTRREETLHRFLTTIRDDYDYIMLDTNPALSTLNVSALFAADRVNVICETHPFSLNALCVLIEELEKVFYELQKKFNFSVIANKYEAKTATAQEILGILRSDYSSEMFNTVIRKCEDLNTASKLKSPVISFASIKSPAFSDIFDLFKEFVKVTTGR